MLTNPFSCLETAMGRRKYHRGKRVRITGVQWCLSQVYRIMAIFIIVFLAATENEFVYYRTDIPPVLSIPMIVLNCPVYHHKNTKVSVHPETGKSLRADFRFLPWNRSAVLIQQVNSMIITKKV